MANDLYFLRLVKERLGAEGIERVETLNRVIGGIAGIVLSLGTGSTALAATPLYHLTDLGSQVGGIGPFFPSYATGINNQGQVVGRSGGYTANHVFLYQNGTMQDLGTLGSAIYPYSINNSGQIAGYYITMRSSPLDIPTYRAFVDRNGVMQDLGSLDGQRSAAYAANDSGQIVGSSSNGGRLDSACIYQNGSIEALPPLDRTESAAFGINSTEQIVGAYQDIRGWHACLFENGTRQDLGSLGTDRDWSFASGINDNGQIIGWSYTTGDQTHAILDANGIMQDLGTLGGTVSGAFGINGGGQIVGWSDIAGNAYRDAFLYQDGSMLDLNNLLDGSGSGWKIQQAEDGVRFFNLGPDPIAINDAGQIAVTAIDPEGQYRAVLLTPAPEPSSLALLAVSVLICAAPTERPGAVAKSIASPVSYRRQEEDPPYHPLRRPLEMALRLPARIKIPAARPPHMR